MNENKNKVEEMLNGAVSREPVLLGTAIVNFVAALISTAAILGLELTAQQQDTIWQMFAAFSVLLWTAAPMIRKAVYSPSTHEREVVAAAATSVPIVSDSLATHVAANPAPVERAIERAN